MMGGTRPGRGFLDDGRDQRSSFWGAVPGPSAMPRLLADRAEHVAQDLDESALALEVVIEHRLVDPRLGGDAVHASGFESAFGKLLGGRLKIAAWETH